jgi:diguanylate cyclase (GGDEF)-like protein
VTRVGRAVFGVLAAALVAFWAYAFVRGGSGSWNPVFDGVLYNAVLVGSAVACLARVLKPRERLAWFLLGVGLFSWAAGDVIYSVTYREMEFAPFPSVSDAFYLAAYPAMAAGLIVLARHRLPRPRMVVWIDATVVALCVTAGTLAIMSGPLAAAWDAEPLQTAVLLGFPVGNAVLLGLVAGVLALSGWLPPRGIQLLVAGLAAVAIADLVFVYDAVSGAETAVVAVSGLWPAGALLVAFAAWQPAALVDPHALDRLRSLYVPLIAAVAALGILVSDHLVGIAHLPYAVAAVAVLAVVLRAAVALTDSLRRLAGSRTEARTDALTGLGNRRRLLDDLQQALSGEAPRPCALLLLDLDGFKQYNDTNGHPAGDALLATLGAELRAAVEGRASAYRLGGDEFCVLARPEVDDVEMLIEDSRAALTHIGDDGRVSASCGTVMVGEEATTPVAALQIADEHLYADKNGRRSGATMEQVAAVLTRAIERSNPEAASRGNRIAELAMEVGRHMELSTADIHAMALAARLQGLRALAGAGGAAELLDGAPALAPVTAILEALERNHREGDRPTTAHILDAATKVDDLMASGSSARDAASEIEGRGYDGGTVRAMTGVLAPLPRDGIGLTT